MIGDLTEKKERAKKRHVEFDITKILELMNITSVLWPTLRIGGKMAMCVIPTASISLLLKFSVRKQYRAQHKKPHYEGQISLRVAFLSDIPIFLYHNYSIYYIKGILLARNKLKFMKLFKERKLFTINVTKATGHRRKRILVNSKKHLELIDQFFFKKKLTTFRVNLC